MTHVIQATVCEILGPLIFGLTSLACVSVSYWQLKVWEAHHRDALEHKNTLNKLQGKTIQ
jgi:hypothetical protein